MCIKILLFSGGHLCFFKLQPKGGKGFFAQYAKQVALVVVHQV
jgi:hypothetical protein